jgi:DNA-binding Xre family transcriptional regulator
MRKQDLKTVAKISSSTIAKLTKGSNVNTDILVKICGALNCGVSDIMEIIPDSESKPD